MVGVYVCIYIYVLGCWIDMVCACIYIYVYIYICIRLVDRHEKPLRVKYEGAAKKRGSLFGLTLDGGLGGGIHM
jgi:hypothetical protein